MWPFRSKKHLRYDSIEAWLQGEHIDLQTTDAQQRDHFFTQLGELRQHLWRRHIQTLPEPEQALITAGPHPSQSHRFEIEALPYAESLQEHLLEVGVSIHSVKVGLYHGDRLVLSVRLASEANFEIERHQVPFLYRGFETKVGIAKSRSTHVT